MSVLDVWNEALSHARARGRLASISENSPEREVCEQHYSSVLRTVQQAAWWPSCKATVRLALLSTAFDPWASNQPEPGYAYAYALPENYLHAWHLTDYSRFALGYSGPSNRVVLSTNTPGAAFAYARLNEDPTQWEQLQRNAIVMGLGAFIAGPLTGKDSLVKALLQQANESLETGRAMVANTVEPEPLAQVPWLVARGYSLPLQTRFFYPEGALFAVGGVSA